MKTSTSAETVVADPSETRRYRISAAQCRAGRAMLGITQRGLAELAFVARKTISEFEAESRAIRYRTQLSIAIALGEAGVEFTKPDDGSTGAVVLRLTAAKASSDRAGGGESLELRAHAPPDRGAEK
jgi:DNA-binding XRE family transcriptional regulator